MTSTKSRASVDHITSAPYFLTIPLEIRRVIYELAFAESKVNLESSLRCNDGRGHGTGDLSNIPRHQCGIFSISQVELSSPELEGPQACEILRLVCVTPHHKMLLTCKQINTEARRLWWQSTTKKMESLKALRFFLRNRQIQGNLGWIRDIDSEGSAARSDWPEPLAPELARMTSLESVLMTSGVFVQWLGSATSKPTADTTEAELAARFDDWSIRHPYFVQGSQRGIRCMNRKFTITVPFQLRWDRTLQHDDRPRLPTYCRPE